MLFDDKVKFSFVIFIILIVIALTILTTTYLVNRNNQPKNDYLTVIQNDNTLENPDLEQNNKSNNNSIEPFMDISIRDFELTRTGFNEPEYSLNTIGSGDGVTDFFDFSGRFIDDQFNASQIKVYSECNDCCR